jgi:hypothetical protein
MADRQTIGGSTANPGFGGSVCAEDGGEVFVYNGALEFDEAGELVVVRGPNVVLEVIDAGARDGPAVRETAAGRGAVHVELRAAAATRLAALLLAHQEGERVRGGARC